MIMKTTKVEHQEGSKRPETRQCDKEVEPMRIENAKIPYYRAPWSPRKNPDDEKPSKLIMRGDSLNLSQAGLTMSYGRLSNAEAPAATASEGASAAYNDPTVKAMKRAFTEMGQALTQIKDLAELALDPELSDLQRLDLQTEMTKLQSKLFKAAHRLGLELCPDTEGYANIENTLNIIGFEEEKMLDFLAQARERIESADYVGSGNGIDISSLSVYTEPAPESPLIHFEPDPEGAILPVDREGAEAIDETTWSGVEDPLSLKTIAPEGLSWIESPARTNGPKPFKPTVRPALPAAGGALTKLRFNDYTVSAERLDDALSEIAAKTWDMKTGVLLTDLKSAIRSNERIDAQMKEFEKLKAEFDKLMKTVPPEGYVGKDVEEEVLRWDVLRTSVNSSSAALVQEEYTKAFEEGTSNIISSNKPMQREGEPERPMPGAPHDMRMANPRNPLEVFAQKLDAIFKDKIYKKLGYSMKLEYNEEFL